MQFDQYIYQLIETMYAEDIGEGDITTEACIPQHTTTSGKFVTKQNGVIAGLPYMEAYFKRIDPLIEVKHFVDEGSRQKAGTVIAKVSGPARGIISGKGGALSLLQHASGVATLTAEYVKRVAGFDCQILDTRKTLPGLRALEKYAVQVGGGVSHRLGLYDRFIIKNNHLVFVAGKRPRSIKEAYEKVKAYKPNVTIEIEVTDYSQLEEALATDAEVIMLDHMSVVEVYRCVNRIRQTNKMVYMESVSSITLDTIRAFAETGVHGIAISGLTHSVEDLDIGMRLMH
ncbi:MAG: carboxylating nicotinate-nucleotide diphosphorylase [Chlamydiales bacterium]